MTSDKWVPGRQALRPPPSHHFIKPDPTDIPWRAYSASDMCPRLHGSVRAPLEYDHIHEYEYEYADLAVFILMREGGVAYS